MKPQMASRLRRSLHRMPTRGRSTVATAVADYDAIVTDQLSARCAEETPESTIFLDLETTGLDAHRCLTSLIGILYRQGDQFRLQQWYSGDCIDEARQLHRLLRLLRRFERVVTYNGDRFDLPFLETRWKWHRLESIHRLTSEDLLPEVRGKYRREWPNCRLPTAEERLLGIPRSEQDVPGSEAPRRFQDVVEGAPASVIEPIFLHNRRDLLSLVALRKVLMPATICS